MFQLSPQARAALVLALVATACSSSGSKQNKGPKEPDREIKPIGDLVAATNQPESIGTFLSEVNSTIKAWNNLFLSANSDQDKRKARLLEDDLMRVTHKRRAELVMELESGPLNNRIVAAAALGFTRESEAQSPLLAALDDQSEEVVSSALLGLWLLGRSDTPLDKICPLLTRGRSENVRTNAALCLATLLQAGAKGDCALQAARLGILDPAPTVRAHCALILADQKDTASMQAIYDLLYDETPLVVSAATRALVFLAREDPHVKGPAARALVKAWLTAKDETKGQLFKGMVALAESNYGSDEKEWIKWADRLP